MKKAEAIKIFKEMLPVGQWMDYWSVQLMWSEFTDSLCKNGDITQEQWNNWTTPISYGCTVALDDNRKWVYLSRRKQRKMR